MNFAFQTLGSESVTAASLSTCHRVDLGDLASYLGVPFLLKHSLPNRADWALVKDVEAAMQLPPPNLSLNTENHSVL